MHNISLIFSNWYLISLLNKLILCILLFCLLLHFLLLEVAQIEQPHGSLLLVCLERGIKLFLDPVVPLKEWLFSLLHQFVKVVAVVVSPKLNQFVLLRVRQEIR